MFRGASEGITESEGITATRAGGTVSRVAAVVACLVVAMLATGTAVPAPADASPCYNPQTRNVRGDQFFSSYVLREGIGLTTWRTYSNVTVTDGCSNGGTGRLSVSVGFYDANVRYKGGSIGVGAVQYRVWNTRTGRIRGWYTATRGATWPSWNFSSSIGLAVGEKIYQVRIPTYLNFGGSLYSSRTITCSTTYTVNPCR